MNEVFSLVQGAYGKVVVLELKHDLVRKSHTQIQFGFWLAGGQCHSKVDDEVVLYNEKQAVVITPYRSHDLSLSNESEPAILLMLYINSDWFSDRFAGSGLLDSNETTQITCNSEMKFKSWNIMKKIMMHDDGKSLFESELEFFLKLCLDTNVKSMAGQKVLLKHRLIDFRLRKVLSYMRENLSNKNLINSLSKTVGVSRSRLYELFKKDLESSPKLMHDCMLLELAIENMAYPECELSSLSKRLGFSSPANFSRFFRARMGIAPMSYRKNSMRCMLAN